MHEKVNVCQCEADLFCKCITNSNEISHLFFHFIYIYIFFFIIQFFNFFFVINKTCF